MGRQEKEKLLSKLVEEMNSERNFFLAKYQGLKTSEIYDLRNRLRKVNWEFRVIKNKLYQRVFKNLELENLIQFFNGPTALLKRKDANATIDPLGVLRLLLNFTQEHPNLKINAGVFEDRVISTEGIATLAQLPPRKILLTQLLNRMRYPHLHLVITLRTLMKNLVCALNEIAKKKESDVVINN